MNGVHDLGGMMGFGPVVTEAETVRFHEDWEKRALALTLASGAMGFWTIDAMRFSRESLHPAKYLTSSYYEIWLEGLLGRLKALDLVTASELETGRPEGTRSPSARVLHADRVATALAAGTPYLRSSDAPARFGAGEMVRTRMMNPPQHTRLPRYARGSTGTIESVHGVFVLPDTNAHGLGECPQWLYTVCFSARDLWGEDADPTVSVSIDAWESYLEHV